MCPLENDNSTLLVVVGGETTRENRENEHSTSVEIIGPAGTSTRHVVIYSIVTRAKQKLLINTIQVNKQVSPRPIREFSGQPI